MLDFGNISDDIKNIIVALGCFLGGGYIGLKKIKTHASQLDLEATKSKTERDVITLIYERLKELETINKALTSEIEALRKENVTIQIQNSEMRAEIKNLRKYIEINFNPTS